MSILRLNFLTIIAGLVFLLLAGKSEAAATGIFAAGKCWPDPATALLAFQSQYPMQSGNVLYQCTNPTINTTARFFNCSVRATTLSTAGNTTINNIAALYTNCDPATIPTILLGVPPVNIFDPVVGAAFWSFAMSFVLGCFLLAKNANAILDAVKNF
jgi:hypothetical protein